MEDKLSKGDQEAPVQQSRLDEQAISIDGIKGSGPELDMPNDGTTETKPSKKLVWQLNTTEVKEITAIVPDNDPSLVFKDLPKKKNGSQDWEGKIKDRFADFTEEKYTIHYKKSDNTDDAYDPIIQVNPEPPLI